MANFDNNTVTLAGRQLLTQALVNGTGLEFVHFGIGDGTAPEAPETLEALVHQLFTVPVAKTYASDTQEGVTVARGSFTNTGERGNFHLRELGLFARLADTEDEPILFGYTNAGESADYIPTVGISSLIEEGVVMTIATGSASVLYVENPTAAAALKDLQDVEKAVNDTLEAFTEEKLKEVNDQVTALKDSINAASDQLSAATQGYVLKAGDTMTGDLNMGDHKVIGALEGSATLWAGWQLYSSLDGLTADDGSALDLATLTMETLCAALSVNSRLTLAVSNTANVAFPASSGLLEIRKVDGTHCVLQFSDATGLSWHGAYNSAASTPFSGWRSAIGNPPGAMDYFAGSTAPVGWLLCRGQSINKNTYCALFESIGYTYGGEGDTFKVPDPRGLFLRCLDAGRGIDPGRALGSVQQSGAPNITGCFAGVGQYYHNSASYKTAELSGAFYRVNTVNQPPNGVIVNNGGGAQRDDVFGFNASLCSHIYQEGLTEVRPANLAVNIIIKY